MMMESFCFFLFLYVFQSFHFPQGDFVFNRMLGPAIVSPLAYGLMDENPPEGGRRALVLVTKVILNVVHGIQISTKEPYLNVLSHLVVEYADRFDFAWLL
jgi:hypothetical protein